MQFTVELGEEASKQLMELDLVSKKKVLADYRVIEEVGLDAVISEPLGNKLFEIKTDNIRSLYTFKKGKIVVVGLIFTKKSQKTPKKYLEQARKILELK
jgi:phage-related protein